MPYSGQLGTGDRDAASDVESYQTKTAESKFTRRDAGINGHESNDSFLWQVLSNAYRREGIDC